MTLSLMLMQSALGLRQNDKQVFDYHDSQLSRHTPSHYETRISSCWTLLSAE